MCALKRRLANHLWRPSIEIEADLLRTATVWSPGVSSAVLTAVAVTGVTS
jgi:hypothetical protein